MATLAVMVVLVAIGVSLPLVLFVLVPTVVLAMVARVADSAPPPAARA